MKTVPCAPVGDARWTQRSALDGTEYLLTFDWNQRTGQWSVDLADADGAMIRAGGALVTGSALLAGLLDPRRPTGELVVLDTTGAGDVDPGFSDLGTRFALLYAEAAELGR